MSVNWVVTKQSDKPFAPLDRVRARPAKTAYATVEQLAGRVRAEYLEMPGLCLTREQAKCLWGLGADACDQVLSYLVEAGFLVRTPHATYVRADGG